jgi:hypothetical protein
MKQPSLSLILTLALALWARPADAFVTKSGAVGGQTWTADTYQVTGDLRSTPGTA